MVVLSGLLVALGFRWRGGAKPLLPGEIHGGAQDNKHTQIRRLVYATLVGLLAWNPLAGLVAYLACLTGWGFPVSAAIGARKDGEWEAECLPFDWLTTQLVGRAKATRYGVVWLTLHGLFFGLLTAMAMDSFWPLLWGLMGFCYFFTRHWERGELAFGFTVGLAIALARMGV